MTTETFVAGPRADYFCRRPTCDGASSPANPWRDLPIKKPRCPACGATRWMTRLYEGYSPRVSTHDGRARIAVNEMIGPEYDRQHNQKAEAQHAQIHDPYAPKLVGAGGLAGAIPGVPISVGGGPGESRPLPGVPRGMTSAIKIPDRIASTVIAGKHTE